MLGSVRMARTISKNRWQRFADHVMACTVCRQAGGVSAPAHALCPVGRDLVLAYEATQRLDPIDGAQDKGR